MTNAEFNQKFCERTKAFAIRSLKFVESLPFNTSTKVLGDQYLRSSTSVNSNYRAFCRSRSQNEKLAKICIVVEEADESVGWLEVFQHSKFGDKIEINWLLKEATELLLVTSSIKNGLYKLKYG